ncbi:MAG TPA: hypothetical protein VHY48_02545 [Acidobacteriaceae bacterium]|jgi:hypothetical protein|nr:hypothetical protein [Acidobacteriaceae bacterium]
MNLRRSLTPLAAALLLATAAGVSAEPLPSTLRATWRIVRILPTTNSGCWTPQQARSLLGTTLTYRQDAMRWHGGEVPLTDIFTRTVSAAEFRKENSGPAQPASFAQLGIHARSVLEVDMQHEDAAILPASTEVPGDSIMIVSPARIVVSACGVYFEAVRVNPHARTERASEANPGQLRSTGR